MPSSVVAKMEYDEASENLRITFVSGLVYDYKHVPEKIYRARKAATSKGTYLNRHIKGNYVFVKVSG